MWLPWMDISWNTWYAIKKFKGKKDKQETVEKEKEKRKLP